MTNSHIEAKPTLDQFFLVKNIISKEEAKILKDRYLQDREYTTFDVRKVSEVDKVIRELLLSEPQIKDKWQADVDSLVTKVNDGIKEYLKKFQTADLQNYNFSHVSVWEQEEHKYAPYHHDTDIVPEAGMPVRHFLCLLYLNDDYEGGELIFPLQGKVIKPEAGMLVIFPTSFMFPHMTTPTMKENRYLMRFTYYLNKEKKMKTEGFAK
jgi:predicted 2-oxoglutarate/Fe(II)-dependent dioxygenase YbiX